MLYCNHNLVTEAVFLVRKHKTRLYMTNRSNEWGNSIKKKEVPVVTEPPAPKKLSLVEGSKGNWAVMDDKGIQEESSTDVKSWPESWPTREEEEKRASSWARKRKEKEIKEALLNEFLEVLEKAYDEKYGDKPGLLEKLFKKETPVMPKRKTDPQELKHMVFDLMLWPDDSLYNTLRDSLFAEFQTYLKKAYDKGYNDGFSSGCTHGELSAR